MSAYRIIKHIESVAKGREYSLIVSTPNRSITGKVKAVSEYFVELELELPVSHAPNSKSVFVSMDKIETVKPLWP